MKTSIRTQLALKYLKMTGEAFISFTILPDRQVTGLLSLPQMEVLLEFDGMSDEAQSKFIDEFDLAFRRGGGLRRFFLSRLCFFDGLQLPTTQPPS